MQQYYTLREILDMPYVEDRKFERVRLDLGDIFDRLLYIDEDGILRYELSEQEELEGKKYGDFVAIDSEILDGSFKIAINKYMNFTDAFNEWYFNNKIICCECSDMSTLRYDHKEQLHNYSFYADDIVGSKWYIEEDKETENEGNDNDSLNYIPLYKNENGKESEYLLDQEQFNKICKIKPEWVKNFCKNYI